MTLAPDTQLNHYRISGKLGEGGMGQVYRAQDTRLRRDVAIKVLPPEVARDEERLARLEREAQVLASLNHPNVAAIYGLEEATDGADGATRFLVMELVEGESLSERAAGGPMDPDEVVRIGKAIAEGLEAAHEKGIIHRDLKPANVMLGVDGSVKVLDFGLAKATEGDPGSGISRELSASPTIMGTQVGVILGTASYMSPEQARGQAVDKRSDIWAFGCVLYEMLGGRRPFDGDTVTDIIAAVVRAEPDVETLPAGTPPRLRELVRRCLVKEPRQRLRDIGDARIELERAHEEPMVDVGGASEGATADRPAPLLLAALVAAGALAGVLVMALLRSAPSPPPVRHAILATEGAVPQFLTSSPGGEVVVYRTNQGLRLRRLAESSDAPLGLDNVAAAVFGSDGFLYLIQEGALRRMDLRGGAATTVAEPPADAWVFFLAVGEETAYVLRGGPQAGSAVDAVELATGAISTVVERPEGEKQFFPWQVVADGNALLGMSVTAEVASAGAPTLADFNIALMDLADGSEKDIAQGFAWPRLVGDSTLLMVDPEGRLVSVDVDPDTLELTGVPVPRIDGLSQAAFFVAYDVAADGSLFYVGGDTLGANERALQWIDRQGQISQITEKVNYYDTDSTISPDGRYLALERTDERQVWLHDLERDTQTPVWREEANTFPVWSPDGTQLAVAALLSEEAAGIFLVRADGSSAPVRLTSAPSGRFHLPMDWSSSGTLVYVDSANPTRGTTDNDLWLVEAAEAAEPRPFAQSDAREVEARFSPDGRWIAYQADPTGTPEVYVRATDGSGGAIPISSDGGVQPSWNPRGGELFFVNGRTLMVVEVETSGSFEAGVARQVWTLPEGYLVSLVEPDPTGERFLTVKPRALDAATRLLAIFNWAGSW